MQPFSGDVIAMPIKPSSKYSRNRASRVCDMNNRILPLILNKSVPEVSEGRPCCRQLAAKDGYCFSSSGSIAEFALPLNVLLTWYSACIRWDVTNPNPSQQSGGNRHGYESSSIVRKRVRFFHLAVLYSRRRCCAGNADSGNIRYCSRI